MRSNLPPEQLARILQQVDDDSVAKAAAPKGTCPHCGREIASNASRCMHCWKPMPGTMGHVDPVTIGPGGGAVRLAAIDLGIIDWFWVFLKAAVGLWLVALLLALPGYVMTAIVLAMLHGR